jgi:hypothetical protein
MYIVRTQSWIPSLSRRLPSSGNGTKSIHVIISNHITSCIYIYIYIILIQVGEMGNVCSVPNRVSCIQLCTM